MSDPGVASSLIVRPMTEADLDAVLAIAASLPAAPQWPRAEYAKALSSSGPRQRIALAGELRDAEGQSRIAGFLIAGWIVPEAEIESIGIDSALHGRGLGTELLYAGLETLRRAGVSTVHLEVRGSNAAARALYRRCGFRETGMRRAYYAHPVEDAVLLERSIGEIGVDRISTI